MNLYFARRYDEAIEQLQKTLELDPNMITVYWWLGEAYEQKGLYDQAVAAHLRHEELSGTDAAPLREAYAASGREGFWRKLLDLKKEQAKHEKASPYKLAEIYVRLGEKDQAFFWLEKSLSETPRGYNSSVAIPNGTASARTRVTRKCSGGWDLSRELVLKETATMRRRATSHRGFKSPRRFTRHGRARLDARRSLAPQGRPFLMALEVRASFSR